MIVALVEFANTSKYLATMVLAAPLTPATQLLAATTLKSSAMTIVYVRTMRASMPLACAVTLLPIVMITLLAQLIPALLPLVAAILIKLAMTATLAL